MRIVSGLRVADLFILNGQDTKADYQQRPIGVKGHENTITEVRLSF